MQKKIQSITQKLNKYYGHLECFLTHKNVFELLIAVSLSAQCTDAKVNQVTPKLFEHYPSPEALAEAKTENVEKLIKATGFYKNKTRNIIKMAQQLVSHYNSEVPSSIEELVTLAGVGRKTANVILGEWFNKPDGVVVDTHVKRISNLLGLTQQSDPEKIEKDLSQIIPKKHWRNFSLWLISLGREFCVARRPQCQACILNKDCDYYAKIKA